MILEEPAEGWKIGTDLGKSDLALLISYKLKQNWDSDLVLIAALKHGEAGEPALDYLKSVAELARIPNTELRISAPDREAGEKPSVTVYSLSGDSDLKDILSKAQSTGTPCLFAMDSGFENALA